MVNCTDFAFGAFCDIWKRGPYKSLDAGCLACVDQSLALISFVVRISFLPDYGSISDNSLEIKFEIANSLLRQKLLSSLEWL